MLTNIPVGNNRPRPHFTMRSPLSWRRFAPWSAGTWGRKALIGLELWLVVTPVLVSASSVPQLERNVADLDHLESSADELDNIDRYAIDRSIGSWPTPPTS